MSFKSRGCFWQGGSSPSSGPYDFIFIPDTLNSASDAQTLGPWTEIIFVEGGSRDRTWETICAVKDREGGRRIKALRQTGCGKGNAVREAFSWLLWQTVKDTLCGTKVMWHRDYFGDFDLLFGASKLLLKTVDLLVHYKGRTYGRTNIRRWRHGAVLLQMLLFAGAKLKFL